MQISGFQKYEGVMAKKKESEYSVILDTSFMIRFLSESDCLHANAVGYFRYFVEHEIPMYFSTISIAEYCVKGDFYDLPFLYIRILPFNVFHGKEAGRFTQALFAAKAKKIIEVAGRVIIPNDSKLFAQGSVEKDIRYFVTSDVESKKVIDVLRIECGADIEHLDITVPYTVHYGLLDFEQEL